jgi:hypothetical protein
MSMAADLLKVTLGIAVVFGLWLAVQRLWLANDPNHTTDEDALAGRTSCHDCTCEGSTDCENNPFSRTTPQTPN